MDVKGESGVNIRPLRKSDRLRQARKIFRKSYLYYPSMRKKGKSNRRAKVSKFAKMLRPKNRPNRTPPSNVRVYVLSFFLFDLIYIHLFFFEFFRFFVPEA